MKPFKDIFPFIYIFEDLCNDTKSELNNYEAIYILNVDEDKIIEHLFNTYEMEPINLFFVH